MDYEKEYNHAFEIAKGYWGGVTDFIRGILESMFPQLAESEDERMRRELLEYAKGQVRSYNNMVSGDYDSRDKEDKKMHEWWKKIVTYLEKQKEQKPELCDMGRWDEESYNNGIHHVLQNLEAYGLTKQKPAEWSEEDEKMLTGIIERGSSQPPFGEPALRDEQMEWLMNRLKSLRPQPHWKPSKEQMGALNYAYGELFKRQDVGHNILGPLQNLIDTLSKL